MRVFSHRRLTRLAATLALLVTVALGLALPATADDWGRDRAAAIALQELDPAIRAAIVARAPAPLATPTTVVPSPSAEAGFAWGAAALGFGTAIGAVCLAFGCVTLVRHDGRLRSA